MITKENYGFSSKGRVFRYTLTNQQGMCVKVLNYGGIITECHVPDRNGKLDDVVLGFDNLTSYFKNHPYFGALVGRVAGRITKAKYTNEGKDVFLKANDGFNHLHGGEEGFDKKLWESDIVQLNGRDALELSLLSPSGDQGYVGEVQIKVIYQLKQNNELSIRYSAKSDSKTPLSLTQHSYFNLAGEAKGTTLGHKIKIHAESYTSSDESMTLSDKIEPVENTAVDLREWMSLKEKVKTFHKEHGELYWSKEHKDREQTLVAEVYEPESGRHLEVRTSYPCLQFYTGKYISDEWVGKSGQAYQSFSGLCLECQKYPNPNGVDGHGANWCHPDQDYLETTSYKFSVKT